MARPDRSDERRQAFRPVIAEAFAELGYRRATTAELAARCGVRENQLFRLWDDKKAMFLDAIDFVHHNAVTWWAELMQDADDGRTTAQRVLAAEARQHGESELYRIVFAGLSETDDPDIRKALRDMFRRFQTFIDRQVADHRAESGRGAVPDSAAAAWAIIGIGLASDVMRELRLAPLAERRDTWEQAGGFLLDGAEA